MAQWEGWVWDTAQINWSWKQAQNVVEHMVNMGMELDC